MKNFRNNYNADGKEQRRLARERAGGQCLRCDSPSVPGKILTVHHFNGDKANDEWWNLLALCQVCHLQIQAKVDPEIPWFLEHSDWLKPYVAGFYAWKYEGRMITREEADSRLDELLSNELYGQRTALISSESDVKDSLTTHDSERVGVDAQRLVRLLQLLAERLVWVAPVGNDDSYQQRDENGVWQALPALRGFMVCKRSVNNVDGKNTRVDFLRVDSSRPYLWKKPFRECEHLFPTMESAIIAAADVEGLTLPNDQEQQPEPQD